MAGVMVLGVLQSLNHSRNFFSSPFSYQTTDRFYLIGHHEKNELLLLMVGGVLCVKIFKTKKYVSRFFPYFLWPLGRQKAPLRPRRSDYSRKKRSINADYKRTHTRSEDGRRRKVLRWILRMTFFFFFFFRWRMNRRKTRWHPYKNMCVCELRDRWRAKASTHPEIAPLPSPLPSPLSYGWKWLKEKSH